jgi:hypothetical protein
MDKICYGCVDIAENDKASRDFRTSSKKFYRRKIKDHYEKPVGNGFHHRPFPMFGNLLFVSFHFLTLFNCPNWVPAVDSPLPHLNDP